MSWTASGDNVGVTSYTISRNGTVIAKVAGAATSFVDATTRPLTAYTYTIIATDAAGNSSTASSGASVTTAAAPAPADTEGPSTPTGLTATAARSRIDLAWTGSTDNRAVAGYRITRDGTLIATTYSTTYSDTGVSPDTAHTYTVTARDGSGNSSSASGSATATAAPALASMAVTYSYDIADRLLAITSASGSSSGFTIDALGRHGSRTVGTGTTQTYSYLGTGDTVVAIAAGSVTTLSAIDALGSRVATSSGGAFGYLLSDLHGNMAAVLGASGTALTDAFRYDAWGSLVGSLTSSLPTPWRFQGRILESAPGTPDLYDFGARSYNPGLGTFTSLDTLRGSAMNPALLNGYLYANGNPASLVDPDGHAAQPLSGETDFGCSSGYIPAGICLDHGWVPLNKAIEYSPPGRGKPPVDKAAPPPGKPDCGINVLCDLNNAIGTLGDIDCQAINGLAHRDMGRLCRPLITAETVAVIVVLAGAVATCNYLFAWCARLVTRVLGLGGTACSESECPELIAQNQQKGSEFETAVLKDLGLNKNTMKFDAQPGVTTVPDFIDGGAIWEIKDWAYLTNSDQIRAEASLAVDAGMPYNIVVSPGTGQISVPVLEAVQRTGGSIYIYDPVSGYWQELFSSVDVISGPLKVR